MQRAAGKQLFSDACGEVLDPSDARGRFGASPPMVMSDQQARLSGRKSDAGPRAVCCWRFRFLGSSERTEPIAPDQSARRNGNLHRTWTAPAIGATAYCRLSYSSKLASYCEYGPIFDPLRPDLKERLRSATPQFLVGTSHATSVHEVLDEEADAINRFHRSHALCRDRTRSVSVLAPVQVLARPLRSVQTQAPPPAD